jgi:hypothetical protein
MSSRVQKDFLLQESYTCAGEVGEAARTGSKNALQECIIDSPKRCGEKRREWVQRVEFGGMHY